jgi:hypothetical protein
MLDILKVVMSFCCGNPLILLVIEVVKITIKLFEGGDGCRGVSSITQKFMN